MSGLYGLQFNALTHTRTHLPTHAHIHNFIHKAYTSTRARTHKHTHTHTHTSTHTHTYRIHAHILTHTRTDTHSLSRPENSAVSKCYYYYHTETHAHAAHTVLTSGGLHLHPFSGHNHAVEKQPQLVGYSATLRGLAERKKKRHFKLHAS